MRGATTCTNHCSRCGRCFHAVKAFDAHLAHDEAGWPVCLAPVDLLDRDGVERLVPLTESGECRMYADVKEDVTIWTTAGSRERLREAFSAAPSRAKALEALEAGDSLPGPDFEEIAA